MRCQQLLGAAWRCQEMHESLRRTRRAGGDREAWIAGRTDGRPAGLDLSGPFRTFMFPDRKNNKFRPLAFPPWGGPLQAPSTY